MSEAKWLAATTIYELQLSRRAKGQHRKWRLMALAWCRRAVLLTAPDQRLFPVLEAGERFADGLIGWAEMKRERRPLAAIRTEIGGDHFGPQEALSDAMQALESATSNKPIEVLQAEEQCRFAVAVPLKKKRLMEEWDRCLEAEQRHQMQVARDIFANPYRPVAFDPGWQTEHTVGIAAKMYDDRDFAAMPILADALEEAGCDNADILSHCREPGVHVRGCWVVDLVLGKA